MVQPGDCQSGLCRFKRWQFSDILASCCDGSGYFIQELSGPLSRDLRSNLVWYPLKPLGEPEGGMAATVCDTLKNIVLQR